MKEVRWPTSKIRGNCWNAVITDPVAVVFVTTKAQLKKKRVDPQRSVSR